MTSREHILVTGGAGYIGSHVNKALSRKGHATCVADNLVRGHRELLKWGEFVEADCGDAVAMQRLFERYRIRAVMHFAAFAYVGESVEDPRKYYENNVLAALNLLGAMAEHEVRTFIFSSSCAVYGNPIVIPLKEDHPLAPVNPYGRTKLLVEQALADYAAAYGLRYASLRYFNAAGADPEGEVGEWHEPETHLIPLALDAASGRRSDIRIFGTDYDTPDGTCIRDYIHVTDLAEAHILALEYLLEGGPSDVFNLGNGRGFSVRQVIETARRVSGREIRVVEEGRRQGDPAVLVGDA